MATKPKTKTAKEAKVVLGKVAQVLKNQPDIEFMVEGHTDNVAFQNGLLQDNWDLSVKRATSFRPSRVLITGSGLGGATSISAASFLKRTSPPGLRR